MAVAWVIVVLLIFPCFGQLLNDTYGGVINKGQTAEWNSLKRYSMYYGSSPVVHSVSTALSNVQDNSFSLSSRMSSGVVSGVKLIIYMFRWIGEFLRKFGAELRVAKCLLLYTMTYQPFSAKVAGGSLLNWLTGYFGAEDANDLYRFLSRTLLAPLGFSPEA